MESQGVHNQPVLLGMMQNANMSVLRSKAQSAQGLPRASSLGGDHLEHVHVIPCPSISNGISNGISMELCPKNVSTQMVSDGLRI